MGCGLPGEDGTRPRELPPVSAFAADDGSADAVLAAVLADHAAGRADLADVVAALAPTRVLVPVLAHEVPDGAGPGAHGPAGFGAEREVETAVVALQAPDGRTALPVFSSVVALAAWRPRARPMPASAARAAASALAEGWPLVVLDPGGPVTVVIPRPAVQALAAGLPWQPAVRDGRVRADVRAAVERVLADLPEVRSVEVEPGRRAEVAVLVGLSAGLDRAGLEVVLGRVNARLASDPMVAQVDSLELRPVSVA
ncbi:SseB family protein [Actinotalea sp. M2MS4P-6]|uniref:SseB family protein n=1 Tax=Actinotalea sp. M2MS4P-6 TaxID=2983762 RepID=UPI0021E417A3|nr:SseB family protein [Actinotalea sp. M2MS4P-6]MCV2393400.1 SseB family protein [Actinotalea sp. M2MS4P-6]